METPENPAKDGGREASTLPAMQAPPPPGNMREVTQ